MNVSFAPLRKDAVAYLSERIGIDFTFGLPFRDERWLCVTARDDEGEIAGVILCEFVNWFEAHFNSAVADPRCVSKRLLRAVFTALFSKAVRLTAFVDTNNARAVKNAIRMGFIYEGFCRQGINGNRDAYTFGMLKGDCRFLAGYAGGTTTTMEYFDGQGRASTT
jgi:hypothetical protein